MCTYNPLRRPSAFSHARAYPDSLSGPPGNWLMPPAPSLLAGNRHRHPVRSYLQQSAAELDAELPVNCRPPFSGTSKTPLNCRPCFRYPPAPSKSATSLRHLSFRDTTAGPLLNYAECDCVQLGVEPTHPRSPCARKVCQHNGPPTLCALLPPAPQPPSKQRPDDAPMTLRPSPPARLHRPPLMTLDRLLTNPAINFAVCRTHTPLLAASAVVVPSCHLFRAEPVRFARRRPHRRVTLLTAALESSRVGRRGSTLPL